MSIFLPDVYVKEFDNDVHQVFQSEGFQFRPFIRMKTNVVGSQVQFPVMGKGLATQKAIQDDITPMDVNYDPITCDLEQWVAADYTDIFSQASINWDDRMELVQCTGMAIGRRSDQIVINALDASGTANVIADGGTGFTFAKFREAFKFLRSNAAAKDICCAISATAEQQLLNEERLTNTFFVQRKPLASNGFEMMTVMGVTFIVIPDNLEGGLPLAGDIRTCFMFAKQSMGMGIAIDHRTEINYIPQKTSWLVNAIYYAGSTAIDPTGIVEIDIDESV